MKASPVKIGLVLCALLSFFISPPLSGAQGMRHWRREGRCAKASELNLTSEQMKGLSHLQQIYLQDSQNLRAQIIAKRIELRELLTNPSARMENIRTKYMEIVETQAKLEEKAIEYLIKVRNLLTQEQLQFWCPEEEFPLLSRIGPGHRPPRPMPPMRMQPHDE